MSGLKDRFPEFAFGGYRVSPDEIDTHKRYDVICPSLDTKWFGTTVAGTSTQAKALVIINKTADYPRNLSGQVAGSSDMGGVWAVNGKDQFGNTIAEIITIGTAANGGTVAGTKVFAEVTSGTFTFTTGVKGSGTPTLGVDLVGTSLMFGLPDKIGGTADVKSISWVKENVQTTLNGGTIGAYVLTDVHGFRGTANLAGTQVYSVSYRPTYNNSGNANVANL